jgi:hypothetical protein
MAKMFASWVPAHGVSVEHGPNYFERRGWGVTSSVAGNGSRFVDEDGTVFHFNYFHISIPTPVIVEDRRATLHAVHYLFDARGGARLTRVDVFDGPTELPSHTGLYVQGNHAGGLDANNGVEVNRDGIAWGIGLTLKFEAYEAEASSAMVYFSGFGGDFYHNI